MHFLFLLCKSIAKTQDAPFFRPFGATENHAQKLHALWLLPMTVVRNTAHEVLRRRILRMAAAVRRILIAMMFLNRR